jgi:hypothetical protein
VSRNISSLAIGLPYKVSSFGAGYVLEDIKLVLWLAFGGAALTFLLVVPPWPVYNQNPVKWLETASQKTQSQSGRVTVDGKGVSI